MKKLLPLALVLAAFGVLSGSGETPGFAKRAVQPSTGVAASQGCLICKRPATPWRQVDVDRCHGDWSPFHNTKNWTYKAVTGADYFQKDSGSGDVHCSECPNGGSIKQDAHGLEDWCVKGVGPVAAATATPSCPQGFTWDCNLCRRLAVPAHDEGIDRCHGNWSPFDNTTNWTYQSATGADHFKRNSGSGTRPCTSCPNGTSIRQDFKGLEDWCVYPVAAVTPAIAPGSCPSGFTFAPH